MSKTDYCVFIGRFQPFHKAHLKIVLNALEESHHVILVVGSYRAPRSLRNPWTYEERTEMIRESLPPGAAVTFVPARDYLYCELTWLTGVQNAVAQVVGNSSVKLIGHFKDDSSYYLKLFPQWQLVSEPNYFGANSTDVRKELFSSGVVGKTAQDICPGGVLDFLGKYQKTPQSRLLVKEQDYLNKYKEKWADAPFEPVFVTTDAVVLQAGHILLVKRGINPGKGRYALPGGFLQKGKKIIDSCLKELKEETNIVFPKEEIRRCLKETHVFDHPARDLRGRTLTHAHFFHLDRLGPLPEVKGGDDAAEAFWMPVNDLALHEENFFSDHFYILNYFLHGIGR